MPHGRPEWHRHAFIGSSWYPRKRIPVNKLKAARRKARADQTNISAIEADMVDALRTLRNALDPEEDSPEDHAMCAAETFVAVALLALKKTPAAIIRNAAQVIEIRAHMDGIPVINSNEENL